MSKLLNLDRCVSLCRLQIGSFAAVQFTTEDLRGKSEPALKLLNLDRCVSLCRLQTGSFAAVEFTTVDLRREPALIGGRIKCRTSIGGNAPSKIVCGRVLQVIEI
jgi:hypothetical protein